MVHFLLPLACDLNLVITSEASRVVNSCSFMGIILFPYFNSTKGVKKATASGSSRIRSSISPIRPDCSIRVYLNFALREQEKLNNLLPQFFCVYANRHPIDTYSSFCVIAVGEIFFAKNKRNKEKVITNALCENLEKLAFSSISF